MRKKICIFVLCIAMIITMLPIVVFADGDDLAYSYTVENGEAIITGYKGSDSEIVIPDMIDGYSVTSIGESAFRGYRQLEKLTIPDSVTSIGDNAFKDCNFLSEMELSNNLKSIGEYAFAYCWLSSISIPKSV